MTLTVVPRASSTTAAAPGLPPSRRGQQNVKPDLMIDLSREVARNAFDRNSNPSGIVDLGSSVNVMMLDELQKWVATHETAQDRMDCECAAERTSRAWSGLVLTHNVSRFKV